MKTALTLFPRWRPRWIAPLGFLAVVAGLSLLGLVHQSTSAATNRVVPSASDFGVDGVTGLIAPEEQGRATGAAITLASCRVRASSVGQGETIPVNFDLTATRAALAELAVSVRDSGGKWHYDRDQVQLSGGRNAFTMRFTIPRAARAGHAKLFCGAWRNRTSLGYESWAISVSARPRPVAIELLSADMDQRADGSFAITARWSGTSPIGIGIYLHDAQGQRWLRYGVSLRSAPAMRTFVVTIPAGAAIGWGTLHLEWRVSDPAAQQSRGGHRSWPIFVAPICRAFDHGLRQCLAQ